MKVSTAAILMKVVQRDPRFIGYALEADKKEKSSGLGLLAVVGTLGIGGPILFQMAAALINNSLFGDPDAVDEDKRKGLFSGMGSWLADKLGVDLNDALGAGLEFLGLSPSETKVTVPKAEPGNQSQDVGAKPSASSLGKVNKGSKLGRPSDQVNDALKAAALKENFDYLTLYAVAGAESTFRADVAASAGSAVGVLQFTAPTWEYLNKVYPEFGYTLDDRKDPEKSGRMASRYLRDIKKSLTKHLGRAPSLGELYLGYFMGPTGARRFLTALFANPGAYGADLFETAAKQNKNIFFASGEKMTLQQTMDKLDGKVGGYYAQASGEGQGANVSVAKSSPSANPPEPSKGHTQSPKVATMVLPANAQAEAPKATARPAVQEITAASLPSANKVAMYATAPEQAPAQAAPPTAAKRPPPQDITLVRDKHNRIHALQG